MTTGMKTRICNLERNKYIRFFVILFLSFMFFQGLDTFAGENIKKAVRGDLITIEKWENTKYILTENSLVIPINAVINKHYDVDAKLINLWYQGVDVINPIFENSTQAITLLEIGRKEYSFLIDLPRKSIRASDEKICLRSVIIFFDETDVIKLPILCWITKE